MTNPKTFDNIDGTPIKVNDPPNGVLVQRDVRAETSFWGRCVEWRDFLNAVGAWGAGAGSINWLGHIGFYFCKDGMHGIGRAMDLNFVNWTGGNSLDLFNGNHAHPNRTIRRRYLSVDAVSRRYFRYVLDGFYNAAHGNHIHQDDTTAPHFSTGSSSDVKFLQAVLNNFNGNSLATDGAWGPATSAAYNSMKSKLGMVTDIWVSSSAYLNWLTTVAVHGITDSGF
jgi:hypothetical protein